jgi:phosphoesterase RecJ-like protein
MSLKKTEELIKKHKVFLITTHVNPEADGIGAELAFFHLIKKLGKSGFLINESKVPVECEFLPGTKYIQPLSRKTKIKKFDCGVFVDCSEGLRSPKVAELTKGSPLLNIDHHKSNTRFASVNWVDPKASSACEMVYRLYRKLSIPVDKDAAVMLYAGITVDTGSFHYNNTTASTHRIAASLIEKGISVSGVHNKLFENNSFNDIKSLGRILLTVERDAEGRINWARIPRSTLKQKPSAADMAESVLGLLRSIKGVELSMIFKEARNKKNQVRINFRSQTTFDCNRLASRFGGGGHKNASGATVAGGLEEVKEKVIQYAKKLMHSFSLA